MTITGLANAQTVQVKRFYDLNGNGLVDAGQDFVVQSFSLGDGQLPIIGGVRNLNVPGDDDGAVNGQIITMLDYPDNKTVAGGMTGKFVFRLEDQNGLSLATQVLTISQKVQSQGVRGRITSLASGLPLALTPVALINPNGAGNPVFSLTDANGNYSFYAPTGSFAVLVLGNGYVSDQTAGSVMVQAGQFVTNNLGLAASSYTISGRLTDASNGKPIPAMFVSAESTNNLFTSSITDNNGNYSFSATPSQWKVKVDKGGLAQGGYLSPQNSNVTISNGSVTGIDFASQKATALVYGAVKDNLNNVVSWIGLSGNDDLNLFQSFTVSGANGNYTLGIRAGNWSIGPKSDSLVAKGYSGGAATNVVVTDGQAISVNFVLSNSTSHLRGQVKDDHGNPIGNIQIVVQPYPLQGNGANSIYPSTDSNGNFDAAVRGGTWNIALECVSAQLRSFVNVSGINYTVTDGVDQNGLILTFPQSSAVITGKLMDPVGNPIIGVTVDANQTIDQNRNYYPGCVSTDNTGSYIIKVLNGNWSVNMRNDELNTLGYGSVPGTNVTISAGAAKADFVAQVLLTTPRFTAISYSMANGTSMTLSGDVAHTNFVEFSSNLSAWFPLTNSVLTNASWRITDPAAVNQNRRFYRAIASP